jgi:hypothetical protein
MGDGFDELDEHLHALGQELSTSVLQGGAGFCGVTMESFAISGVTHYWRKGSKLKIAVDFDDLGQLRAAQVKEAIEAAVNEIRAVTDGLSFELFTPTLSANLVCKLARLDGPNGVLADCQIPMPNASTDNTQLIMRIDTGEVWRLFAGSMNGAIDFQRVWLHEFLHGIGLGHKPASIAKPALIAPMYSPAIRNLQEADIGEIVRRYGGRTTPVTPPPAPGAPAELPIRVSIDAYGLTYSAAGSAKPKPQGIYVDRYPTGAVIVPQPEDWDNDPTDPIDEGELS